jgi:uncharacterized SAM-binding protein YcdF (DUF218 family)
VIYGAAWRSRYSEQPEWLTWAYPIYAKRSWAVRISEFVLSYHGQNRPSIFKMRDAKPRRTFRLWVASTAVICLLLAGIAYPLILTRMAQFLLLSQKPEPADLILILGGDFYGPRALLGAELGKLGYAPKVLISGALYQNRPEGEFAIRFLVERGYRRELFVSLPSTTQSTIEEALAVCPELDRLGARRVLIVTSAYHSRRSNVVFRLFCPGVRFRSIAAADAHFEAEYWWKKPQCRRIFFSEWEKIIGTVIWKYPEHNLKRLRRVI